MLIRLIFLFGCIIAFINGCNNLISGVAGTHKLRVYEMEAAFQEGIGDADFIQVTGAYSDGSYLFFPSDKKYKKPMLIYPLLTKSQVKAHAEGKRVKPAFFGWTEKFDESCEVNHTCIQNGEMDVLGLIAASNRVKKGVSGLASMNFEVDDMPVFIKVGRKPIPWYWNLAMMVAAITIVLAIESRNYNKKITKNQA